MLSEHNFNGRLGSVHLWDIWIELQLIFDDDSTNGKFDLVFSNET